MSFVRPMQWSKCLPVAGPSRIRHPPTLAKILPPPCRCQRRTLFSKRGTSFWSHSYPATEVPQVPYTPPPPDLSGKVIAGEAREEGVDGQRKDRKQRYLDSLMDKAGELSLRCSVLDSEGNWTAEEGKYKKSELCREHDLDPRDLRKLDSLAPSLVPIILTRKTCIIISMLHIKVLIKPDRVIVFDNACLVQESETQKRFKYHLERNIKAGLGINQAALESVLVSSANALEEEMAFTRHLVQHLLADLEDDINRENLKRLLRYSKRIVEFQSRARYVKRAADEVLESDEDLSAMYLTSRALGRPRALHDHEQLELLLESFVKQVEEIVSEVDTTVANMNSTQEIAELMLDSGRNALLALDIKISIATLGIGTGALVAGLFGMNLTTQLESTPYAFLAVSGSASLIAILVMLYGTKTLRRVRRVALTDQRSDELTRMMNSHRWDRSVEQFSKGFDPFLVDRKSSEILAKRAIWNKLFSTRMGLIKDKSALRGLGQSQNGVQASREAAKQAKIQARISAWNARMKDTNPLDNGGGAMFPESGVWKWGKGYGHSRRWAKD
uniref:Magnesium transporter n=1 Tax=Kwoniella dejecticola CBS 10117 TaxID=1296121 RepID=A0A1A6A6X5_9TREE|nr:magnesium transporter [Kwoniella dejecticola CBS 10117]OBR85814.1 magnesium transporter [Kwoniella dejecticola CBS 10117]